MGFSAQSPLDGSQHRGGPSGPAKSADAKNSQRTFGLGLLVLGVVSVVFFGLGRGLRLLNWQTWSHAQARYVGARGVASGRSGGGGSCERSYELAVSATPVTLTTDAPCLLLFGSDPEPGALVDVAYPSPTSTKVLSETEVFGVGAQRQLRNPSTDNYISPT